MRVLAITHSLAANGAAWCLCRLVVALRAQGAVVDVLYEGNQRLAAYLRDHGVGIVASANTEGYDVALVNTLLDHRSVIEIAPALPVVFWLHEGVAMVDNDCASAPGWMQAFRLSSRLVFVTPWQYQTVFASFLHEIERHRIVLVHPGVSLAEGQGGAAGTRPPGRAIVSVGSLYPRKRPADLVAAVLRLGDASVSCTMVGDTALMHLNGEAMGALIARHAQQFTVTGEVGHEQTLHHLRGADVYCSASGDEAFSLSALEAAAIGLPLAMTELPGHEGVWRHGVNALLAPVGAIDCLSWNLKALLEDRRLADRLALAARQTAARYGLERCVQGMSEVLLAAIRDPVRGTASR